MTNGIIKNFGRSPAIITSIATENLNTKLYLQDKLPQLVNSTIAPNQKFTSQLISPDGINGPINPFNITIEYKDGLDNQYLEKIHINTNQTSAVISTKTTLRNLDDSDKNIRDIAQAIVREFK